MKVKQVMKKPAVTLKETDKAQKAFEIFHAKDISGAAVLDKSGKITGYLSEGDITRVLLPPYSFFVEHRDEIMQKAYQEGITRVLGKFLVKDLMTDAPKTISDEADVFDAVALMNLKKLKHMPVTKGGKVVGNLSRRDIIKALMPKPKPAAKKAPAKKAPAKKAPAKKKAAAKKK